MGIVLTDYFYQQMLVNAKAGTPSPGLPGIINGAKMILYTNLIDPASSTILADLTVPAYTGYASQNAVFGTPYRRGTGGIAVNSAFLEWQMGDAATPTRVYGYGIVDSAGTHLLGAEAFGPGGINLTDTLDAINISSEIALGGVDEGVMALSH